MFNIYTSRATGSSAVSLQVAPGIAWELCELRIHLSAAGGAGNLTATVDAGAGAAYDAVILTQDMTSIADLVYAPDVPIQFDSGDKLDIAWANSGGKTYGIEAKYKERAI